MGTFGMNTGEVYQGGNSVTNQAGEFGYCHRKINEIIDNMITSDYTTDDAIAIAEGCKRYDTLLNQIEGRLEGYGMHSIHASRSTTELNEDIKSRIAKNI